MSSVSGGNDHLTRRQFLKALGALGLAATGAGGLLAACGGEAGSEGGQQTVELTVSHWPSLLYTVPWALAMEQGAFDERGIDLKGIVGSSGGGTTVRNVVTGGLPLGAVATPAAINGYTAGAPLKILGSAIATTSDISFVTLPDNGIQSIEDLRGKRVGFTNPGSVTQGCIVLALEEAGIDPKEEVTLQAMGGLSEALTGLKEGAIDAAPMLIPIELLQKDEGWQLIFRVTEYVSFMQLVLIAGSEVVEEQPDLLQSLVDIYREAVDATISDPPAAAAAWAKHSDVPEEVGFEALGIVDPQKYYSTQLNADSLKTVIREMKAIDLLGEDAEVDWEGMVDQRFLPEDERLDLAELK